LCIRERVLTMDRLLDVLNAGAGQVEATATNVVARIAPWAAPVPTAYLVGRATVVHLGWPDWVGLIAAIIVESLGLATTATALELREYNASKRKSDPHAPFKLAAVLVGVYFAVAVGLTVALDIAPGLAMYAPAVFPVLSLTGLTVLALRGDHRRRVTAIEASKTQRRAARRMHNKGVQQVHRRSAQEVHSSAQEGAQNDVLGVTQPGLDRVNYTRQERKTALKTDLLGAYRDNPRLGATAAGRQLGVHRNTIYTYAAELEAAGHIRRNGDDVEVLV